MPGALSAAGYAVTLRLENKMMMAPWILVTLMLAFSTSVTRRRPLTYRVGAVRARTGVVLVVGAAFMLIWMSVGDFDPSVMPLIAVMQIFAVALGVITVTASVQGERSPRRRERPSQRRERIGTVGLSYGAQEGVRERS